MNLSLRFLGLLPPCVCRTLFLTEHGGKTFRVSNMGTGEAVSLLRPAQNWDGWWQAVERVLVTCRGP